MMVTQPAEERGHERSKYAFHLAAKTSALGIKESLRELSHRCGPSTSGPSGASSKPREEHAILQCSTSPSIASSGPAMLCLKVEDIAPNGYAADRATVHQRKTGQPVRFEMTESLGCR